MQHHDYPLPPPEILALIERGRRRNQPEEEIKAELARLGLDEQAIAAALAPGATVVTLAESSHLKIPQYAPGQMLAFGVLLGFPGALYMAWKNSRTLRGQDRMGKPIIVLFAAAVILLSAHVLASISVYGNPDLGDRGVGLLFIIFAIARDLFPTLVLFLLAGKRQGPFRRDAASRDELAPASMMVPFLITLPFILLGASGGLIPVLGWAAIHYLSR